MRDCRNIIKSGGIETSPKLIVIQFLRLVIHDLTWQHLKGPKPQFDSDTQLDLSHGKIILHKNHVSEGRSRSLRFFVQPAQMPELLKASFSFCQPPLAVIVVHSGSSSTESITYWKQPVHISSMDWIFEAGWCSFRAQDSVFSRFEQAQAKH